MNASTDQLLSKDELADLQKIMNIKYASSLNSRFFSITTSIEKNICEVTVTLQSSDQSYFYPVEGHMDHIKQNLSTKESHLLLLDYIDSYFDEYFREDENVFIPITWSPFEFDGYTFMLKGQIFNKKQEKLADELLKNATHDCSSQAHSH